MKLVSVIRSRVYIESEIKPELSLSVCGGGGSNQIQVERKK